MFNCVLTYVSKILYHLKTQIQMLPGGFKGPFALFHWDVFILKQDLEEAKKKLLI